MTTNHRPTLESKRGRANGIKDTIQHSRSLKSQSSLKLRLDVKGTKFDPAVGKRALDELQNESKRHKLGSTDALYECENKTGDKISGLLPETETSSKESNPNDDKDAPVQNIETGAQSESDGSSEYESEEDDEEELMAELAKIKKEKEEQKKKEVALNGNPLIDAQGNDVTSKKSWRSGSPFGRKATTHTKKEFTTNTLESETHRKFLTKYFR